MIKIKKIEFTQIKPIWERQLWPSRQSLIRGMSSMKYLGGIDMEIYEKYKPTFFCAILNNAHIVGVNSGHRTDEALYRSRGIWVDPDYRREGVAQMLFQAVEDQAIKEKCTAIWSLPRESALSAYERYGFSKQGNFFDEGLEYGPNCYVIKIL